MSSAAPTILQVEDDPNDVFFLQRALRKIGVVNPVQVAQDGRQAIDYLNGAGAFSNREEYPMPCMVLLDLKLPYVMGLEVLKWIRQNASPSLIVVILTASAEDADIATAYCLGANAFLTKPPEASKLEDMLRSIQSFWLTHNILPRAPSTYSFLTDGIVRQRQAHDEVRREALKAPHAWAGLKDTVLP